MGLPAWRSASPRRAQGAQGAQDSRGPGAWLVPGFVDSW
jgi:imidazolonepropionase-like amidohydrolase